MKAHEGAAQKMILVGLEAAGLPLVESDKKGIAERIQHSPAT